MKLLLLAAALLAVEASPLNDCSWGPSYWCQSYDVAVRCGKTQYCNKEVWKNGVRKPEVMQVKSEEECTLCKYVVGVVLGYVETNKTEEEAKDLLKQVCNYMGAESSECRTFVDEFIDIVWEEAKNRVSADVICGGIKLCDSSSATMKAMSVLVASPSLSVECKICDFVAEYTVIVMNSKDTEDEVKKELIKACSIPKPVESECEDFVNKHFDTLWDKLKDKTQSSQGVCAELFSSCPKPSSEQKRSVQIFGGVKCDICKLVVKELMDKLVNAKSIETEADKLCGHLPKDDISKCEAILNNIIDNLWNDFDPAANTEQLCQIVGFCSNSKILETAIALYSLPPKHEPKADNCDICKLVSSYLKTIVDSTQNEAEVKSYLEKLCSLLPNSTSSECTSLVDQYFPVIWDLVKNDIDSGDLCQQIGLCNSTKSLKSLTVKKPQVKGSIECTVCELVVQYLDKFVDENSTEAAAQAAVEKLCDILPDSKDECDEIVKNYFPMIWELLKSELDSADICKRIGLCNSTVAIKAKSVKQLSMKKSQPKADLCDICKLVSSYLKTFVDSTQNEAEVKSDLENLCSRLPSSYSSECTSLVDQYFPVIWDLVKSEIDSGTLCQQLGLCISTKSLKSLTVKKSQVKGIIECKVCEFVVQYLDKFVNENSTEAAAQRAAEKVCDILPDSVKDECTNLIIDFFPTIWKYLMNEADPDTICSLIRVCQSTSPSLRRSASGVQGIVTCLACELVMKEIENLVNMSNVENITIETLEKVCSIVPEKVQDECKTLIDTYGREILDALVKGESPKLMCGVIGLCSSQHKELITTTNFAVKVDFCPVCEELLNFTKMAMKNDPSFFSNILSDFCTEMPSAIQGECSSLVKEFAPEIVNLIANAINAHAICKDIRLCTVYKKAVSFPTIPKARPIKSRNLFQGITCVACTEVLEQLEALLPKEKDAIVSVLSEVCKKHLSGEANSVCQFVLSEFGGVIIQAITDMLNPRTDCKVIGLCKSSSKSPSLSKPWRGLSPSLKVN